MAARCLIHEPELILADEPTNDLDEHWSEEIIRILKEETGKGTAVVMVTHNSRWAGMANRRCRLDEGVLINLEK
jgi:putative ABC transport system ATP-binding protein